MKEKYNVYHSSSPALTHLLLLHFSLSGESNMSYAIVKVPYNHFEPEVNWAVNCLEASVVCIGHFNIYVKFWIPVGLDCVQSSLSFNRFLLLEDDKRADEGYLS